MFCKVLFRIIFNLKKDKEVNLIPFDGYILMDIFFAVVNLLCYLLIDFFGPGLVLDETYSRYLMLLACFGALSAISRFFFLFLVEMQALVQHLSFSQELICAQLLCQYHCEAQYNLHHAPSPQQ